MKSILIITAFAASVWAFTTPASAEPARVAVSTAGLDLSTAAGVRALDLRILHAASWVCGTASPADGRGRSRYEDCRAQAREAATVQRERVLQMSRRSPPVNLAFTK